MNASPRKRDAGTRGEIIAMPSRKRKKLRPGFTTGTAAAAAAKAALLTLLGKRSPRRVQVMLLTGVPISIPIQSCRREDAYTASCTVIKDAGDDPDITHRAEIGARVTRQGESAALPSEPVIRITGGKGVGMVTKPGLEVPPGEPAINPGPRRMITHEISEVLTQYQINSAVAVEIFVPEGEALARKTLNARLGIIDGISILGTTGVVKPLSHEAYIATIAAAVSVARAAAAEKLILSTGRRSERYAQVYFSALCQEAFVQIGDHFKASLELAVNAGFRQIALAVFFGKALKMAQGFPHTHAAKSQLSLQHLAGWASEAGHKDCVEPIRAANTGREAFTFVKAHCPDLMRVVAQRIVRVGQQMIGSCMHIQTILFDYDGSVQFDSDSTERPIAI
jgi:cobalt-precorrin-5B (C1)-methyltransferase